MSADEDPIQQILVQLEAGDHVETAMRVKDRAALARRLRTLLDEATLHQATRRAFQDLPDGCTVVIHLDRGSFDVTWYTPSHSGEIGRPKRSLVDHIEAAVDACKSAEVTAFEGPRQAKPTGSGGVS